MKRSSNKLGLHKQTIRVLTEADLGAIAGGLSSPHTCWATEGAKGCHATALCGGGDTTANCGGNGGGTTPTEDSCPSETGCGGNTTNVG